MLAATKLKMSANEKKKKRENRNTYDISSIKRVTRKFLEVPRCSGANSTANSERNVQKVCCVYKKDFFGLLDLFFSVFVAVAVHYTILYFV